MSVGVPKQLGKYTLGKELGRGASGIVYLANDPFAHRDVAIKVYLSDADMDASKAKLYRKLFFNEAHVAGKLVHPSVLPIYDAGEEGGLRYVVMMYLEGYKSLAEHTRQDNLLPIKKVVEVFFAMAKALDYAHRNGVIHRDIKPANVMIGPTGQIMIVDFGVAKHALGQSTQITGIVGTPRYMSPEQVRDEDVGNQTDLFSMGVMIYEMLTGVPCFFGDSLPSLTHQIINTEPAPLSQLRNDVPDSLNKIVLRCLKKNLKQRYKTGMDVAGDLINVSDALSSQAEEIAEQERYNLLSNLTFFSEFTQPEIWEIMHAGAWKNFKAGDVVVKEGELDDSFFVIVSGEATVHKGKTLLGSLKAGDCFGEMGYLNKTKRSATVRAKSDVSVLRVNATLMEKASRDCQLRFYKVFAHTLIERLTHTTEKLQANA
ncbi:MAG TPA: serine/threonine-protein kinase [Gammaproteobacteria bacterium]